MPRLPLLLLLALPTSVLAGDPLFSLTVLPDLGDDFASVKDVNAAGVACGFADLPAAGGRHGVIWVEGAIHDLGPIGTGSWTLKAINDAGQCAGTANLGPDDEIRAVVFTDADGDRQIDPGELVIRHVGPTSSGSDGWAINGAGDVAGTLQAEGSTQQAFIAGSINQVLGAPGSLYTYGDAINDAQQVAGAYWDGAKYEGCRFDGGTFTSIAGFGGYFTGVYGMNGLGQCVGETERRADGAITAFLWLPEPAYGLPAGTHDLAPEGLSAWANDINDHGVVVGRAYFEAFEEVRAVAWIPNGDGTFELVDLQEAAGNPAAVLFTDAQAISNTGIIVGRGRDARSIFRAVILEPNEFDTDGDGLLDSWETNGIDVDGDGIVDLDLPAMGADPLQRNIFVEIDAMDGIVPSEAAIAMVEAAFASAPGASVGNPGGIDGVILHIQVDELDLPYTMTWSTGGGNWPLGFAAFRAAHFGTVEEQGDPALLEAKAKVFRYGIYCDHLEADLLGIAVAIPSDDFVICKGRLEDPDEPVCTDCDLVAYEAGTLMHELGHCLGLRHGGADGINFKPNYVSVMNYMHEAPWTEESDWWSLDYSHGSMASLDESALDESLGFYDATGQNQDVWSHFGETPCDESPPCTVTPGPFTLVSFMLDNGPFDFDGDQVIESSVCVDLNAFRIGELNMPPSPCETLHDHDDWAAIQYAPIAASGASPLGPPPDELTVAEAQALIESFPRPCRSDLDRDGSIGFADVVLLLAGWGTADGDVTGDGTTDFADLVRVLALWGACA